MFKHLALTNNELASTLFEPWSQYMPQAGSVQGEQGGVLQVLYALVWLFFCVGFFVSFLLFLFFFSLLKDTTSILLLSESTNETIHRGTKFVSYSSVKTTDFGLHFCDCVFLTHKTTFWSLLFK